MGDIPSRGFEVVLTSMPFPVVLGLDGYLGRSRGFEA